MPSFDFELGQFSSTIVSPITIDEFILSGEPLIEYPDPYSYPDPNSLWNLVWLDEIPECNFVLETEDGIPIYIFLNLRDVEEFLLTYTEDYLPTFFIEEFEPIYKRNFTKLVTEESFYTFALMTWKVRTIEEFYIVFPSYWLTHETFFDFDDSPFINLSIDDVMSIPLPTINFDSSKSTDLMGDEDINLLKTIDEYLSFPIVDLALRNTDLILDDINPNPTLTTLVTSDGYYSLIAAWSIIDSFYIEPSETFIWGLKDEIVSEFYPPINYVDFYKRTEDTLKFVCSIAVEETFGFPIFKIVDADVLGDIDFPILAFEDIDYQFISKKVSRTGVITDAPFVTLFYDPFKVKFFLYDKIVDSFINWDTLNFKTYFDFFDFNCLMYEHMTYCISNSSSDFEDIVTEMESYGFMLYISDTYEMPLIDFERMVLNEIFYEFDIWATASKDYFDYFNAVFITEVLAYEDNNEIGTFSNILYFSTPNSEDIYGVTIDNYLLHIEDYVSFDVDPVVYQELTSDEFPDFRIMVYDELIYKDYPPKILKNGKLLSYPYYPYIDYAPYEFVDTTELTYIEVSTGDIVTIVEFLHFDIVYTYDTLTLKDKLYKNHWIESGVLGTVYVDDRSILSDKAKRTYHT